MFAEHGQHSFIEYLWTALKYLFVFSDAFRWTNATASTKSFFFETYTRARILGSDIINLWGSDPGFRFCRARNLAQQGKVRWKSGVVGWDFVGNARSDLTHVCDLQNPSRRPRHPYWREGCWNIYIYTAFLPSCLPAFLPSFLACMHPCMHACVHACIHDTRVHARRYHLFTFQVSLETRTNKTSECGSSARKMCLTITYDNVHERAIQRLLHLCVFVFCWEVVFFLQSSHANLTSMKHDMFIAVQRCRCYIDIFCLFMSLSSYLLSSLSMPSSSSSIHVLFANICLSDYLSIHLFFLSLIL